MTDASFKKLTGIMADDHNSIRLEAMDHSGRVPRLFISIEASGMSGVFFFDNPHEARTFFTRALHQVGLYTIESTPAEDLKAEIFGYLKGSTEFKDITNTKRTLDLLTRAADLLGD